MTDPAKSPLPPSWMAEIGGEFAAPYMAELREFLRQEKAAGNPVFPPSAAWFAALHAVAFDAVKVVILGQDPYHGPGQAHGLSFSVPAGVPLPPSLQNIYRELGTDLNLKMSKNGNLVPWAEQGVLLLNAVLTVRAHQAASHQGRGWERFTDAVVGALNQRRSGLVFLLWGSHAQKKGAMVDRNRHLVLSAPHPSPLSASRGFFGCRHFSMANQYLEQQGLTSIDWQR
jgi:uracil-DNA glycosylase